MDDSPSSGVTRTHSKTPDANPAKGATVKKSIVTQPTEQAKRGPGQPPKSRKLRYPIRIYDEERVAWRVAAARCGMQLLDWIPHVLNAEALQLTHIKPLGSP
jgi:hypothetical protein